MPNRISSSFVILSLLLSFSSVAFAQRGQRSGATANPVPAPPHDPHDLSGVWTKTWRTLTISEDVPPMTSWGKAQFDSNKPGYGPRAVPPALGNDPTGKCDPLGLIRNLLLEVSIYQMEFVQTPKRVRQFPANTEPSWMGHSVGKWEGDTFVVNSTGFDERTWLDHFGNPHSDEMRLEERYRRVDRYTLEVTMTLTDPKTYTKP